MRLRQVDDVVVRQRVAVDAAQVVEHHAPAKRQQPVQEPAGQRHANRRRLRHRHRRRAGAIVRQRQRDGTDAVAAGDQFRARPEDDLRRAVVVARDREVVRLDLRQRRLARKQLDARFLRGEARGEACGAARAVAAVRQFLRA